MNRHIQCEYPEGALKPYIRELLELEEAELFFPVTLIRKGEQVVLHHRIEGWRPFSAIGEISAETAMGLLLSLLRGIRDGQRHYIFTEDYVLKPEGIYTDRTCSGIRLCFVPAEKGEGAEEKVEVFLEVLEPKLSEDGRAYIAQLRRFLSDERPGFPRLLRYVSALRREIYLCGIA